MKILFVNRVLYPRSASETAMFCLAETLEKMGHEITFFAQDDQRNQSLPGAYVVKQPDPSSESRLRGAMRLVYDRSVGDRLVERLRDDRPDVALVWQVNRSLTYATLEALQLEHIPAWVMLTDFTPLCPARTMVRGGKACSLCADGSYWRCIQHLCLDGKVMRSILGAWENRYLRLRGRYDLATGFMAPSEYHRQRFQQSGMTVKPIISANLPLPTSAFAPVRTSRGEFFLYVGTLAQRKGLQTLLQALKQCVNRYPLVIAGSGSYKAVMEQMAAQLGVSDRVRFMGHLPPRSLRAVMCECLCVIAPSECEEIAPWALLEAQALGKPAIVSDFGVLPERVTDGETGYVFPAGKDVSLAQCMDDMAALSPEEYAAMCAAAAEHAQACYSPAAYAQRVLDVIRGRV